MEGVDWLEKSCEENTRGVDKAEKRGDEESSQSLCGRVGCQSEVQRNEARMIKL